MIILNELLLAWHATQNSHRDGSPKKFLDHFQILEYTRKKLTFIFQKSPSILRKMCSLNNALCNEKKTQIYLKLEKLHEIYCHNFLDIIYTSVPVCNLFRSLIFTLSVRVNSPLPNK